MLEKHLRIKDKSALVYRNNVSPSYNQYRLGAWHLVGIRHACRQSLYREAQQTPKIIRGTNSELKTCLLFQYVFYLFSGTAF